MRQLGQLGPDHRNAKPPRFAEAGTPEWNVPASQYFGGRGFRLGAHALDGKGLWQGICRAVSTCSVCSAPFRFREVGQMVSGADGVRRHERA